MQRFWSFVDVRGQTAGIPKNCGGQDLNLRPPGHEPGELPGCSTPQFEKAPRAADRKVFSRDCVFYLAPAQLFMYL
jgi:hypothetical protein